MPKHKPSAAQPVVVAAAADIAKAVHEPLRPRPFVLARSLFAGPMPPPDVLREYEEIFPGAAEFFFNQLERQMAHRQEAERKLVDSAIRNELFGMWLAFVLALILVLSGGWLIHEDKNPQGMSVIATTLATFTGAFVYSYSKRSGEIRRKHGRGRRPRDAVSADPRPPDGNAGVMTC
ncbi:MAG TPA: DUF2335 domain-containing protein [Longimicrobium sp.]|nr:DUF2335 domain-containing protein [Longimicrobium sp.]